MSARRELSVNSNYYRVL